MLPFRVPLPNLQMTQQKPHADYHKLREKYELPIKHFRVTFYVPPKMASPNFLSEVLPSLPGPHEPGYYNSQPKNSMRIPVTNERAGVGTAVIGNRSCAIGRDDIPVEIHQTLASEGGGLCAHPMRGVAR